MYHTINLFLKTNSLRLLSLMLVSLIVISCKDRVEMDTTDVDPERLAYLQSLYDTYAPIKIEADITHLSDRERLLVAKLAEAGKVCDDIFWLQSSHDAVYVRDSLSKLSGSENELLFKLVNIYYGPYNKMDDYKRFVGNGADVRPLGGGFYPEDMTKSEFEKHIKDNPSDKEAFESQYTVIIRGEDGKLTAVPYHLYYSDLLRVADLLDEAVELCDNASLKKYLQLRAIAFRTSEYKDYFASDWAWMELVDNNIDVVIGPIESYEDGMFNYKTAFECKVMVKDIESTKQLQMFKDNVENFQRSLPWDSKYYVEPAGGSVVQIANVVSYHGDCNKATKSIAAALPNDPAVYEPTGGKQSMYKNLIEAKFEKILKPIAEILIEPEMLQYVSAKQMMSFVTLHEITHNLGRGYVFNKKNQTVRQSLKGLYSALEECKADICALYCHKVLFDSGQLTHDELKKTMVTYVAGLFRSMRFGSQSAHGISNFIQFRYLLEHGAIYKTEAGYFTFNEDKFFNAVTNLTKTVLELQAEGDYNKAEELINKYGHPVPEIMAEFDRLKSVPTDLNSTYMY